MNDRIERFALLKSFFGGILSQRNILASDFENIEARTEVDGCVVKIRMSWDGIGKISIRSQEALATLRVLTEGSPEVGGEENEG